VSQQTTENKSTEMAKNQTVDVENPSPVSENQKTVPGEARTSTQTDTETQRAPNDPRTNPKTTQTIEVITEMPESTTNNQAAPVEIQREPLPQRPRPANDPRSDAASKQQHEAASAEKTNE
jgi:hypothetical protein